MSWRHCLREVSDMVAIYVRWVKAGKMRIEDVPAKWREQVREEVEGRHG